MFVFVYTRCDSVCICGLRNKETRYYEDRLRARARESQRASDTTYDSCFDIYRYLQSLPQCLVSTGIGR